MLPSFVSVASVDYCGLLIDQSLAIAYCKGFPQLIKK